MCAVGGKCCKLFQGFCYKVVRKEIAKLQTNKVSLQKYSSVVKQKLKNPLTKIVYNFVKTKCVSLVK